jgi:nucleotide-binding universal stress UspA family protein
MTAEHVLLCYFGSADSDATLRRAAQFCRRAGAELSVVLPVVDGPVADGCCGIQGEHWQRLTDEDARRALAHAVRLLDDRGSPAMNVAVEAGASIAEIAQQAAMRWECDLVAVRRKPRPWSGGLSRRRVKALRRSLDCELIELDGRHASFDSGALDEPRATSAAAPGQ